MYYMLKLDATHSFTANWNDHNAQLNPNRGGLIERSVRKTLKFLFIIPNCLVAACVNPRSQSEFYPSSKIVNNAGYFTKKIITPDQVHLRANVNVVQGAVSETPTVILFNPLGANDLIHEGLKDLLIERKCNVITFNYRGLGTTRRAEDLIIDGESVYQYAINELGIKKDKVHFYGFSLGGALAAQVKALHPESKGKYVGDRVLKSIFSLITENCCIKRLGSTVKKITSLISAIFIAYPIYLLGWEWDGCKAFNKLEGDKRLVFHPHDYLVPYKANLATLGSEKELIKLDPNETGPSTHFSILDGKNTAEGADAVSIVADFLSK